jgi:hypothetical protein
LTCVESGLKVDPVGYWRALDILFLFCRNAKRRGFPARSILLVLDTET